MKACTLRETKPGGAFHGRVDFVTGFKYVGRNAPGLIMADAVYRTVSARHCQKLCQVKYE